MSEGMSGGTYPNRNWPLSLNEKIARASKMAEGRNAPYAMERRLARDVLDLAKELAEANALEQQAKMGWDESRRRERELRADLTQTRRALQQIKDYVLLEYQEGDKPFQFAILATTVLAETQAGGARAAQEGEQATKLDKATTALRMIEENEHGESWSAGVAMSALASLDEVGYPKPHPRPDLFGPYTMGMKLCDDDGIVRSGRFHKGTDYPCTGHAHFAGEHIECTSPAHAACRDALARAAQENK
jgi:hypothetical protein